MNTQEKIKLWERTEGRDLFEGLGLTRNAKILDYGCGFGHYTIAAARYLNGLGEAYAVDIDTVCLKHISDMITVEELEKKGLTP